MCFRWAVITGQSHGGRRLHHLPDPVGRIEGVVVHPHLVRADRDDLQGPDSRFSDMRSNVMFPCEVLCDACR